MQIFLTVNFLSRNGIERQVACVVSDTYGLEITSVFLQQINHEIALRRCSATEIDDISEKFFMFLNKEKPIRNRDTNFTVHGKNSSSFCKNKS